MGDLPDLASVASTLRAFAEGTDALQVTVVIDQGEGDAPAVVTFDNVAGSLEVVEADEARIVPDVSIVPTVAPLGSLHLHSFPPFEVDLELGQVTGVIGGIDHLAKSVISLAALFGGHSVASARFQTVEGPPLEIGGRGDGEAALSCGDIEFETPDGWPGP